MDPARWDRLEELVEQVLALPPGGREAFLEEACGADDDLRAEVESLLRESDEAFAFMDDLAEHVIAPSLDVLADEQLGAAAAQQTSFTGKTISHYEVRERLGAGGMGVVYRARDERLERFVALKFLPPHLGADERAKERLLTEARAASALDHPNLCTVHDIGETDENQLFIAMAYYEGETLRQKIKRGPLSPEEACDYALQIAEGLARAHEAGIVHRDVKPPNVMVTQEGVVKMLDFGIAKVRDVTATGQGTPGTVAYMSPEQVRGEAVDHRSDIWSLGVVLYEMLTGERPFGGEHEQTIIYSILHEEPRPLAADLPGEYEGLKALIEACLQKDPEARPGSMEEVAEWLQAGTSSRFAPGRSPHTRLSRMRRPAFVIVGLVLLVLAVGAYAYLGGDAAPFEEAAAVTDRSIMVLPFANVGGSDGDEYFADGMTDDLLSQLALVPDFSVISRTTSMLYKGTDQRAASIAGDLGVRYVLEGSVRRAGDRVRITSQLIDGQSDQYVWTETFDRRLEDVFDVQAEIASAIAEALETELSSGVAERIERRPTEDMVAYDLFLRGREDFFRYDREGTERAIESFRAVIDRDPDFALARAWLGRAYGIYAYNHGRGAAWADSALVVSREALAQQPDLIEAYTAKGTAYLVNGRLSDAERVLRRVLELSPNDGPATVNLGLIMANRGRLDEGIRLTYRSLENEPSRSFIGFGNLGSAYTLLEMYDEAEESLQRGFSLRAGHWTAVAAHAWLHLRRERRDEARELVMRLVEEAPEDIALQMQAGELLLVMGEYEQARKALARVREASPALNAHGHLVGLLYGYTLERTEEPEAAAEVYAETMQYALERIEAGDETRNLYYTLAGVHALREELEEALDWLEEATRFGWLNMFYTRHDPLLESLRGEPAFETIIGQMLEEIERQSERLTETGS